MKSLLFQFAGNDSNLEQLATTFIAIMLITALVCFLVGEITRNYSQVDKLWSIMPVIYGSVAYMAFPSPRLLIMSILIFIWGFRLSFNFYRKGGYNIIPWKGEEDYRWKIMQQHPKLRGRIRFGLFNLLFISFYQHLLILLFSTPLLIVAKYQNSQLSIVDVIATILFLLFVTIESIADNQQYMFQKLKRESITSSETFSESIKKGFISEGLWKFVRHPNYISEQATWLSFYLFGVAASGDLINWTLIGPVLLILLFLGSTGFTESISSNKYSEYSMYKKAVPKYIPRFFK
jgi:steroid 5-alpha reductase family enzyme